MAKIYGDGIHDDTLGIQTLLDSGRAEIYLEAPEKNYLISKTLKIHANQTLRMAPTTVIRLADDSNCCMLEDDDFSTYKSNICIDGGIWDFNNLGQEPNPYWFPGKDGKTYWERMNITREQSTTLHAKLTQFVDAYSGMCMRFCRIKNFTFKNLTLRNPCVYGCQLGFIENFTIENITFDYTVGNIKVYNMDGVHIEGGCKNGHITNLKGTCHDDLLAITSDDGLYGPIENITVDGIFAENCHSAVRLLSHGIPVKNIHIRNVFGSYYVYAIGITKYHGGEEERGIMSNITLENITVRAAETHKDIFARHCPMIWVQNGLDIEDLTIRNVVREEDCYPSALFQLEENSTIKRLHMEDIVQKNLLGKPLPFIVVDGNVEDYTCGMTKEL